MKPRCSREESCPVETIQAPLLVWLLLSQKRKTFSIDFLAKSFTFLEYSGVADESRNQLRRISVEEKPVGKAQLDGKTARECGLGSIRCLVAIEPKYNNPYAC
jgi:hypothetical protein